MMERRWSRHSKDTVCEDELNWAALAVYSPFVCDPGWGGGGVGRDYHRAIFHATGRVTGQRDISQQKHHSHTEKVDQWAGGGKNASMCMPVCVCVCGRCRDKSPSGQPGNISFPCLTILSLAASVLSVSVCPQSLCWNRSSLNFTLLQKTALMRNASSFLGTAVDSLTRPVQDGTHRYA